VRTTHLHINLDCKNTNDKPEISESNKLIPKLKKDQPMSAGSACASLKITWCESFFTCCWEKIWSVGWVDFIALNRISDFSLEASISYPLMHLIQTCLPSAVSSGDTNFFQRVFALLRSIFFLAVPTFFTILLENAIPVVTTVMIGGLGEKYLAAGMIFALISLVS
jgi:hypothetical protein